MTIELPKLMRTLEKDERGYPIPVIIQRDQRNKPMFTVNSTVRVHQCARKRLCSICGKRWNQPWFVSGSRAFLSPHGAFLDPPLHLECAEYALRVCPFLAASKWAKSITKQILDSHDLPAGLTTAETQFVGPAHPEWFGLGRAGDFQLALVPDGVRYTVSDWQYVEFWRHGESVPAPDADEVRRLMSVLPTDVQT